MAVRSAVYNGVDGAFGVIIPPLAYRKIVSVKREGTGYSIVSDSPVGRQVQYESASGGFTWENAFTGVWEVVDTGSAEILVFKPEKIFIIWEE